MSRTTLARALMVVALVAICGAAAFASVRSVQLDREVKRAEQRVGEAEGVASEALAEASDTGDNALRLAIQRADDNDAALMALGQDVDQLRSAVETLREDVDG